MTTIRARLFLGIAAGLLCPAPPATAAEPKLWLDPQVQTLPVDKMGPFVSLEDGKILTVDDRSAFISSDRGATWSAPIPMFPPSMDVKISNERMIVRTKAGTIVVTFMNLKTRTGPKQFWVPKTRTFPPDLGLELWTVRSVDGGKTWIDAQRIQSGYAGAVRALVQAANGNLVLASQDIIRDPAHHATAVFYSADEGKTWKQAKYVDASGKEHALLDAGGHGHHDGSLEPTVELLRDGRLWMLMRTGKGRFWQAFSKDHGVTWTDFGPSDIPASAAPAMLKRLASGRLLMAWNRPYPEDASSYKSYGPPDWHAEPVSYHREELSVAFSEDDGKTWTRPIVIAQEPKVWISYAYVFEPTPGEIWLTTMQGPAHLLQGVRVRFQEKDLLARRPRIVAFGDSTTAPRGELMVYSRVLRRELPARGVVAEVINAGIGGHSTQDARKRFERDVLAHEPAVVVIQFGINDASVDVWKNPPATKPRVSLSQYEEDLHYFIETLKGRGTAVILMTPNSMRWTERMKEMYGKPPYKPEDVQGFNVLLTQYADAARRVAKEENVPLIDVYAAFESAEKPSAAEMLPDGVHPDEKGQRLVAELLMPKIEAALKRQAPNTREK